MSCITVVFKIMKCIVKAAPKEGVEISDKPVPTIGYGEVLIKIKATGICGTDVHIYNWDEWAQKTIKPPMTIGHEFVGTVAEIGAGVSHVAVGDVVSGEGHIACGKCRNCLAGRAHICRRTIGVGVNRDGAFAEYLAIPATNVWKCNPDIPAEYYAFFDPYGNAVHTALSFDLLGEDILITGAGPIGAMAVAVAKHAGARHVVITDVNEYRLELARKMGATLALNVAQQSLEDAITQLNMTEGFDVGLEMSGNAIALRQMIANMRNGGKIAMLGIQQPNTGIDWDQVVFKGLTIKGIYGREMFETWYKATAMIQSGLDVSPILTHQMHYTEFQKGFDIMRSGNSGKIVLWWE